MTINHLLTHTLTNTYHTLTHTYHTHKPHKQEEAFPVGTYMLQHVRMGAWVSPPGVENELLKCCLYRGWRT